MRLPCLNVQPCRPSALPRHARLTMSPAFCASMPTMRLKPSEAVPGAGWGNQQQHGWRAPSRRGKVACRALESYMVDKLRATEMTFKELQLKMADPDVSLTAGRRGWLKEGRKGTLTVGRAGRSMARGAKSSTGAPASQAHCCRTMLAAG